MNFAPEPAWRHGRAPQGRVGILLVNLGTPDAPTPQAVRRYLAEFLSDPRVVEIPSWAWQPILQGIVLRTRPKASAAKYASIWSDAEGSPLRAGTEKVAKLLAGYLGERQQSVQVRAGMRYGNPSIASALDALKAEGATRILVLPLYPQYAASTTASAFDAVAQWALRTRTLPELRFVNRYHDEPLYIRALEASVREHWQREGRGEAQLVLSFHGLPRRSLEQGDPYHCECRKTARLLAERLQLPPEQVHVTFQSRFGRAKWLEPATDATFKRLATEGVQRIDVLCPGFAVDCLETLEEISIEGRAAFLAAGGREFHYIACLNDRHAWIDALAQIAMRHLQGWPAQAADDPAKLELQRQRALALGAEA